MTENQKMERVQEELMYYGLNIYCELRPDHIECKIVGEVDLLYFQGTFDACYGWVQGYLMGTGKHQPRRIKE